MLHDHHRDIVELDRYGRVTSSPFAVRIVVAVVVDSRRYTWYRRREKSGVSGSA
jgi:hypothetical protein